MKKIIIFFLFFLSITHLASAQIFTPVKWSVQLVEKNNNTAEIHFTAKIENKWHLYATDLPAGGPQPTTFNYSQLQGAELAGDVITQTKAIEEYSSLFEMKLSYFNNSAVFVQPLVIKNPNKYSINGRVQFMACNDETCLPPTNHDFQVGKDLPLTTETKGDTATNKITKATINDLSKEELWTPVIKELNALGNSNISKDASWWSIFLSGFIGGLLAILTPCVWPMIPMTMSFFLKGKKSRRRSIMDALLYGFSIILIYVGLGLVITMLFGASALNNLATNAVFNVLFFALLVLFSISFFGAFELTLPATWTNRIDKKADATTGIISIFFMAFTLVLVSFSCTGPIIGTLLVQAATMSDTTGPAIGMFGFSTALAVPFALFAIFPSLLKQMPRSGGWLNSVKVILGFLELALALKFLSIADLAYGWHILDREVFLVLWIIIFALLGLYLLGKLPFRNDSPVTHVSPLRLFLAIISLSFSLYMFPGLWGAPLKAISAFTPPLNTQDLNLYKEDVQASFHDYEAGMKYAAKAKKPVLLDFSGYGCVNCRKMEASVWTHPSVKRLIDNDYVLITLMVDDKTPLKTPEIVKENGKKVRIETVGEKWSYLQRYKFGANAQPYYILLNDLGEPLAPSYAYNENIQDYINFLINGLKQYNKTK